MVRLWSGECNNVLSGVAPALSILAVTSDAIAAPATETEAGQKDPHQRYVMDYLEQERFEQVGMVYYKDSISAG